MPLPPGNNATSPAVDSTEIKGTSIGLAGQPVPKRLASIDIFRGLTMLVMIFVNDLDSVKGLPWWTYHMGRRNGMTYVDMVFPAFLFIVGMSIPLAVQSRLKKNPSMPRLWLHVFLRTVSLLVLGLILANAEKGNQSLMGIAPNWWAFIALVGAFLLWNVYPSKAASQTTPRILKLLGLAILITLFAIFRRTTRSGQVAWIDISYWEILGIIGWAYLSACILYIPTRRWRWAPLGWFIALLTMNICVHAKLWTWPSSKPPYFWPFGAGDSCMIVMAGIVTSRIFSDPRVRDTLRRKFTQSLAFAAAALLAGWVLTPLGISKIYGTPTWCLYCIASSVAIYALLYWICDVKRHTAWAAIVKPAGANTLTTYLIPDLYYFAVAGTVLDGPFPYGWPGVVRAVVFTFVMLGVAAAFTKAKIRLQL